MRSFFGDELRIPLARALGLDVIVGSRGLAGEFLE